MERCSANYGSKWYFLKGHIFDLVVFLAVTYDSNNNQYLLSYAVETFESEDNWV